jgi:hypothetical protein
MTGSQLKGDKKMKVQMLKKARTLLLYAGLLAGMLYSALAVTTRPVHAACDCSAFDQETVDAICQFSCLSPSGHLISCDASWVIITCNNTCPVVIPCD